MDPKLIRVGVVEDHPLYRQGLIQTVESSPECELVFAAPSVERIDDRVFRNVDVLLLDLHLPGVSGADAVACVKDLVGAVVVISASDDRDSVIDAVAAGANGYLPKSSEADEIAKALNTVASGGTYVSPVLAAYLLSRHDPQCQFALTAREREILSLLAEGETDADIAEALFISVRTVRSHLDRIRDKTGRRRRADLTRLAYEQHATDGRRKDER
jgi:DNA-binding NarL/FixJ family response regulator